MNNDLYGSGKYFRDRFFKSQENPMIKKTLREDAHVAPVEVWLPKQPRASARMCLGTFLLLKFLLKNRQNIALFQVQKEKVLHLRM